MKIIIIDNHDSFTYNLFHYIEQFEEDVIVKRIDEIVLEELAAYDAFVLSPGPGLPYDRPLLMDIVKQYAETKVILGVCLGHQAIAITYGGKLRNLNQVLHGVAVPVVINDKSEEVFKGLPEKVATGRYHSWVIDREGLPDCIKITATDENGNIMAIRHKKYNLCGIQFHPESIMTEHGFEMVENWVESLRIR